MVSENQPPSDALAPAAGQQIFSKRRQGIKVTCRRTGRDPRCPRGRNRGGRGQGGIGRNVFPSLGLGGLGFCAWSAFRLGFCGDLAVKGFGPRPLSDSGGLRDGKVGSLDVWFIFGRVIGNRNLPCRRLTIGIFRHGLSRYRIHGFAAVRGDMGCGNR